MRCFSLLIQSILSPKSYNPSVLLGNSSAYIGYNPLSTRDTITAKYLELILYSLRLLTSVDKKDFFREDIAWTNLNFYFAVFPSDFATVREIQYDIKEEIKKVISSNANCKIFIIWRYSSDLPYVRRLVDSVKNDLNSTVYELDFSQVLQEFEYSAISKGLQIMPEISSSVTSLMIRAHELSKVSITDRFSDLYFEIYDSGVRHCPVIDEKTDKCIGIISRRDVIKLIPPSNIPDEIAKKIGLNKGAMNEVRAKLGRETIGSLFTFPQKDLKFLSPQDTLKTAIDIFRQRQQLQSRMIYISGLPILGDKNELQGFISYEHILKDFIVHQHEFLRSHTVSNVGTIIKVPADFENIRKLRTDDTLTFASSQLDDTLRSLPVISIEDSGITDEFVGWIDDIKVKMFSHEKFTQSARKLAVQHIMIPAIYLPEVTPDMKLEFILPNFWDKSYGSVTPSSFAVTESVRKTDGSNYRSLKGVISYTDILKAWWTWNEQQDGRSHKEDKTEN
jgi:CBS domain-containing protein